MDSLPWGKVNIAEKRLRQPLSSTAFFRLDPDHYLTTYNAYSRFALYDKNLNLIDSCTHYSPITTQITPEKVLENYYFLTSSLRTPKFFVKEFSYFLMPCHQHGLRINLLVQRQFDLYGCDCLSQCKHLVYAHLNL